MNPFSHPLFTTYPITGSLPTSQGSQPTPYHIYDGYGLFIGGGCDLAATRALLGDSGLQPVQTTSGRAVTGLWICDFTEASHGPHHELQFSIFVTRRPAPPIADRPVNAMQLMLARPDVRMLCHGLWNSTLPVVAYNREILSLNAQHCASRIERSRAAITFDFRLAATAAPILSGTIKALTRSSLRTTLDLLSAVGMRRLQAVNQQPWLGMKVLNPLGVVLDYHAAAQTYTKNSANYLRFFQPGRDSLTFGDTPYQKLNFIPRAVQSMEGFKFVYLNPAPDSDE